MRFELSQRILRYPWYDAPADLEERKSFPKNQGINKMRAIAREAAKHHLPADLLSGSGSGLSRRRMRFCGKNGAILVVATETTSHRQPGCCRLLPDFDVKCTCAMKRGVGSRINSARAPLCACVCVCVYVGVVKRRRQRTPRLSQTHKRGKVSSHF